MPRERRNAGKGSDVKGKEERKIIGCEGF